MPDINTVIQKLNDYIEKGKAGKQNDPWDIQWNSDYNMWQHRHPNYNQEKASRGGWHKLEQKHKKSHAEWIKFEQDILFDNKLPSDPTLRMRAEAIREKYGAVKPTEEEFLKRAKMEGFDDSTSWSPSSLPEELKTQLMSGAPPAAAKEIKRQPEKIGYRTQPAKVETGETEADKEPDDVKYTPEEEQELKEAQEEAVKAGIEVPKKSDKVIEDKQDIDWDKYYRQQFAKKGYEVKDIQGVTFIAKKNAEGKFISDIFAVYKKGNTYKIQVYDKDNVDKTSDIQDELAVSYSAPYNALREVSEYIERTIPAQYVPDEVKDDVDEEDVKEKDEEDAEIILAKTIHIPPKYMHDIFYDLQEELGPRLLARLRGALKHDLTIDDLIVLTDPKKPIYRRLATIDINDIVDKINTVVGNRDKQALENIQKVPEKQDVGERLEPKAGKEAKLPAAESTTTKIEENKPEDTQEQLINRWKKNFTNKKIEFKTGGTKEQPKWGVIGANPKKPNIKYIITTNPDDETEEHGKYTFWEYDADNPDNEKEITSFSDLNTAFDGMWKYIYHEKAPIQKSDTKADDLFAFLDSYKKMAGERIPDKEVEQIFKTLFSQILNNKQYLSSFAAKHNLENKLNDDINKFHEAKDRVDKVIAIDSFMHLCHQNKGLMPIAFGFIDGDDIISNRVNNILTQLSLGNDNWRMVKQVADSGGVLTSADSFTPTFSGGKTKRINFFK